MPGLSPVPCCEVSMSCPCPPPLQGGGGGTQRQCLFSGHRACLRVSHHTREVWADDKQHWRPCRLHATRCGMCLCVYKCVGVCVGGWDSALIVCIARWEWSSYYVAKACDCTWRNCSMLVQPCHTKAWHFLSGRWLLWLHYLLWCGHSLVMLFIAMELLYGKFKVSLWSLTVRRCGRLDSSAPFHPAPCFHPDYLGMSPAICCSRRMHVSALDVSVAVHAPKHCLSTFTCVVSSASCFPVLWCSSSQGIDPVSLLACMTACWQVMNIWYTLAQDSSATIHLPSSVKLCARWGQMLSSCRHWCTYAQPVCVCSTPGATMYVRTCAAPVGLGGGKVQCFNASIAWSYAPLNPTISIT